jgi:ABC-2 type transport system ATP-binding protein
MLEMKSLTKRFGGYTAVAQMNLAVRAGELFALLGPNAAGKTTTVKMIVGLLRPTAGVVSIGGCVMSRESTRAKSLVGYVPDVSYLYERLTVSETLDFVMAVYGVEDASRDGARESVLKRFDLYEQRNLFAGQLSHGMRQRLVFAMAMVHAPRLLVVDEPFVGLDPRSAYNVKEVLKEQVRNGGAVFMCTHTLSVAEELADRIGIISKGRVVACGTLQELRGRCGEAERLEEVFLRLTEREVREEGA